MVCVRVLSFNVPKYLNCPMFFHQLCYHFQPHWNLCLIALIPYNMAYSSGYLHFSGPSSAFKLLVHCPSFSSMLLCSMSRVSGKRLYLFPKNYSLVPLCYMRMIYATKIIYLQVILAYLTQTQYVYPSWRDKYLVHNPFLTILESAINRN